MLSNHKGHPERLGMTARFPTWKIRVRCTPHEHAAVADTAVDIPVDGIAVATPPLAPTTRLERKGKREWFRTGSVWSSLVTPFE
jgi:hypothetical protein